MFVLRTVALGILCGGLVHQGYAESVGSRGQKKPPATRVKRVTSSESVQSPPLDADGDSPDPMAGRTLSECRQLFAPASLESLADALPYSTVLGNRGSAHPLVQPVPFELTELYRGSLREEEFPAQHIRCWSVRPTVDLLEEDFRVHRRTATPPADIRRPFQRHILGRMSNHRDTS